jgi:mono/diheme cytochrome c family protein
MKIAAVLLAVLAVLGLGGVAFVYSGLYDISATDQHLPPTFHAMKKTMERSVERRARDIPVPGDLGSATQLVRGLALFRAHCVQCHGAPGVAPEPFALALRPLPTPLVHSGREREPGYLYWVVKQGIKMTAMPSWEMRMSEDDMWAVVAFMRRLPHLSPAQYAALHAPPLEPADIPATGPPDAQRGKRAMLQYACVACHQIPGVTGAEAAVGPPLHGVGSRKVIGGVLDNTPDNMARWLMAPREYAPGSAMPNLGVTSRDAADMAAYLATLR